jgi:TorA maturation chaperone TorD
VNGAVDGAVNGAADGAADSAAKSAWLRRLGWWWLRELRAEDVGALLTAEGDPRVAELRQALAPLMGAEGGEPDADAIDRLAAEHHRLLGFAVPPYESVFVDPSTMMMAPATARVSALYRHMGWRVPEAARAGAPDHVGAELLALAEAIDAGDDETSSALLVDHLALWAPAFLEAVGRARPAAFYGALAEASLEALMGMLSERRIGDGAGTGEDADPFPILPPPPRYRGTGMAVPEEAGGPFDVGLGGVTAPEDHEGHRPDDGHDAGEGTDDAQDLRLRDLVRRLLTPREAGLWIGRADAMQLSGQLGVPTAIGNRAAMLEAMLRAAGGQDAAPAAFDGLLALLEATDARYETWAERWPAWQPYARAWRGRVAATTEQVRAWRVALED